MLRVNLMGAVDMSLTDEEEQHILGLVHNKYPCPCIYYMHRFGYVCDSVCANNEKLKSVFSAYLAEREYQKYLKEYPE